MSDTTTAVRQARCTCGRIAPSDCPYLAFFEDRRLPKVGECAHCPYTDLAHERINARAPHLRHVPPHEFEQRTEGREYDAYYCGHGGWD